MTLGKSLSLSELQFYEGHDVLGTQLALHVCSSLLSPPRGIGCPVHLPSHPPSPLSGHAAPGDTHTPLPASLGAGVSCESGNR